MATKTSTASSSQIVPTTATKTAATPTVSSPTPVTSFQYYSPGDTAYYSLNGKLLPVIVERCIAHGNIAQDGTNVSYIVSSDISGSSYPAGYPITTFKNVPVASLSAR